MNVEIEKNIKHGRKHNMRLTKDNGDIYQGYVFAYYDEEDEKEYEGRPIVAIIDHQRGSVGIYADDIIKAEILE